MNCVFDSPIIKIYYWNKKKKFRTFMSSKDAQLNNKKAR